MADEQTKKPDLKVVSEEELDEEEKEFRALRRDVPGVKGAAEAGILTISVGRQPARFEELLTCEGINWPRKEDTGKLDLRRKTFESMAKAYPQIEPLRQLRYIRDKLRTIQLSVGHDGRNRTVLWPFSSKTSRTQPKAKHWIFSPSVWLRFLIKPEPGK